MKYIEFDESRPMDLVLLGRVAIDFNPAYNDQVKEEFKPLKKVHMFEKFVGGSPANIAVGVTKHGLKAGFIGKVSDDQFGEYVVDYFGFRMKRKYFRDITYNLADLGIFAGAIGLLLSTWLHRN